MLLMPKTFVSLLNLRTMFVLATLILLAVPLSQNWLRQPDHLLFKIGANLTPEPAPSNTVIKVLITQAEMDRLVNDMPGALAIGDFLISLRPVFTKGILLVMDEMPDADNYAADVLVTRLVSDTALRETLQAGGVLSEIESLGARRNNFYSQVRDGALLLAISESEVPKSKINYLREGSQVEISAVDKGVHDPLSIFKPGIPVLTEFRYESKSVGFPVFSSNEPTVSYPLLWRAGDEYFPDATLALLKKSQSIKEIKRGNQAIYIDDNILVSSAGARIYPMYSTLTGVADRIETLQLSDLKAVIDYNRFYNKTVIVGVRDSRQMYDVAAAYYSLENKAYYTTPAWYFWIEKGGLLILLLYLFLLVPLLRINLGLIITAFIGFALVVFQIGMQISQMQWIPIGLLISYLVFGHAVALLWMLRKVPAKNIDVKRVNSAHKQTVTPSPERTLSLTRRDKAKKLILGHNEIVSEIGRGAMGVVYLGRNTSINRKEAIKTLNYAQFSKDDLVEVKERFFREARAAGNLKHQNIVTIYESGEDSERAFIAMEYVGGKPLSAYVKKGNLLPPDEVYWVLAQVAEALGYAHDNNIVHRDIKPSNILYDRERQEVKVADFGIARIIDHASTKTGDILGSPLYMSPEQIKGEKVTGRTDIFSLGITMYQLLTGELPFNGDSMVAITHQIVNGKFTPVTEFNSKLPESAQHIIAKALQKNPEKRFETAYEMSDMLQKYMNQV